MRYEIVIADDDLESPVRIADRETHSIFARGSKLGLNDIRELVRRANAYGATLDYLYAESRLCTNPNAVALLHDICARMQTGESVFEGNRSLYGIFDRRVAQPSTSYGKSKEAV